MDEAQIRERIDALARALRAKDVDALMAHYARDNITYDVLPPLQVTGADAYRKNFERWFASLQGPIDYEIRDLHVATADDLGLCHYLGHVKGTRKSGEKSDYWVRVTSGWRKMNGRWMVVHEHVSMPVSMEAIQ
jgi:ketosteroid isomerase-like protein